MSRWMTSFLGDPDILPDDPIILVNEYAYYNGSLKMGKILKVIFGAKGILDRMFTGAVARWTDSARPAYKAIIDRWSKSDWHLLTNRELLECVRELTTAAVDGYLALVSGVIPAAWMSEGWFALRYRFWKRKIDPWAAAFLMGFDNLPIRAEKNLFDLAQWVLQDEVLTVDILQSSTPVLKDCINLKENIGEAASENWDEFHSRFNAHLDMYGHMIYDLDFANPVPADDCTPVLETFKLFLKGEGTNPHQRQMKAVLAREKAVEALDSRRKGRRLRAFRETLIRAQKYAPLREDGLADVGLSYPLLRQMLFELGERFVNAGVLEDQKDIFWLRGEEVEAAAEALDLGNGSAVLTSVIPERKATWEAAGHAVPPMILPQLKVFGFDLMSLKSGVRKNKGQLKGVGASPGLTTARACVVHGPEDFAQMKTGDVLVAPLTTPAWTPLFARAAAVVTDIGGPLSHGSIVAREYGIPAVLGTGAATKTIATGQRISVDGTAGLVTIANGKPD
jgi:pyruvate,water dikinase